jgi:anti-sigma factor RsiW
MDHVEELSCQELVELVTHYLEGRLEGSERVRFEQHLAACEGCRTYVEQMRQTVALLGTLTGDSLGSPAKEKLLAAFRDWKRDRPTSL